MQFCITETTTKKNYEKNKYYLNFIGNVNAINWLFTTKYQ